MKIQSVHIYGFGRFSNVRIEQFNDHLQVIYGENEAGKTTLMAFIRAMLFGFPTRQESELRYEPKQGAEYGGKLTIETERYGQVVIERVKGKARGNVTVSLEDGTVGHDELLKDVIEGLDRSMYQAIFSFGLQDMQHLDMLQSDEIGSYLYSVGMAGKWNVSELEKQLEKRQGELFKPSGKLPIINQQLAVLQALEKLRTEKETELQRENELLQAEEETEANLLRLQVEANEIRASLRHEERLDMLTPLVLKQKELTLLLKKLPEISTFPHQGMEKIAELRNEEKKFVDKYAEIDFELTKLQTEMNELAVSEELINKQVEIKELHVNLTSYQDWKRTTENITYEHKQRNEELAEILQKLGEQWNKSTLSEAVTTMEAKEELVSLNEQYRALTERASFLEVEKSSKESTVNERRRELERIKAERMSEQEQERLSVRLQQLMVEESKLKEAMIREQNSPRTQSKQSLFMILLLLLSVALTFTGIQSYWLAFGILAIGFVLVLVLFLTQNKRVSNVVTQDDQQVFISKLHEIELEKQNIQMELSNIRESEQQSKLASKSYEDALATYENILRQQEQVEQKLLSCDEQLDAWCERGKFPPIANCTLALSVFGLVEKGQELLRAIMQFEDQLQQFKNKLKNFEEKAEQLARFANIDVAQSIPLIVEKLVNKLKKNEQKEMKLQLLLERTARIEKDKLYFEKQLQQCREKIQRLFHEANVETEESFIEKGMLQEEKIVIERDLRLVDSQLEVQVKNREQLEEWTTEIENTFEIREERKRELEERLSVVEAEEKEVEKQLFACQTARQKLGNESELAALYQKIEVEKTTLKQYAMEWAIHKTAKQMIKKAKAIYEEKRQPEVMQAAEKWFNLLTCGQYTRVFAPIDEATVTVERKDEGRFLPEELSQGTKEQLYLALRIALAEAYRSQEVFPLIIDDVFVNFDDERKRAAAEAIKKLSSRRQVLLFTCHAYIKQLFSADCHLELKKGI